MKFETIVLLLWFMIVFVQSGFGHRDVIQSCNQKNEILLRENTWLAIKNKNLSWKLKCLSEKECIYNGVTYTNGDIFHDDCNACVCNYGTVACTDDICGKDCAYSGQLYADGSNFTSESGCYSCSCINGCVDCTTKICLADPLAKAYATQSSINDNLRAPSLAIDGYYDTMMTTSFPAEEAMPWWMVELRCEQTIEAVRLWSRDDGFPNSLSDLTVSVDDVYCGNVTVSPGVGASVLVTCDTPLAGRTVKVTRDANTLTMAEVELITIC